MTPRQGLDSAIDHVAKQLTHVEDDAAFASRIVASLPEQTTWFGWLLTSWAPRLAMLALVAASSMLLINREPRSVETAVLPSVPLAVAIGLPVSVEPELLARGTFGTKPLEPLEPLELLEAAKADHEFSLPGLDVEALPPMNLPLVASIEVAPLAIVDLPLSGEFPERY